MGRQSMKLRAISLAFLVFVTNLTCVEDLLREGTCNWTCTAESGNINAKELKEMISQGKLIKLKFMYDQRIDQTCASQTNANNTNGSAKVWLRNMAADNKPLKLEGSTSVIAMLSQTVLEGIYSGQFVFGGYKEIYVSCIYRSTTKPTTNQLQRLAFHTPQSVMYYVENLAKYTNNKNYTLLTLIRMEKQTRISFGVTSTAQNSSITPDNDNELLVYSNGWLFISIVIWIAFVLYSPAVFLLCLPSEVTVQLVSKTRGKEREDGRDPHSPIQESVLDDNNINAENRGYQSEENHASFRVEETSSTSSRANREERDYERQPPSGQASFFENNDDHAKEHDYIPENDDIPENEDITSTRISMEAQTNVTENSEMVMSRSQYKTNKTEKTPFLLRRPNWKTEDKKRDGRDGKMLRGDDKQSSVTNDNKQNVSVPEFSEPEPSTYNTETINDLFTKRNDFKEPSGSDGNGIALTDGGHTSNEVIVDKTKLSSTNDKEPVASTSTCSEPLDGGQKTEPIDANKIAAEFLSGEAATDLDGNRTAATVGERTNNESIVDIRDPWNHSSINPTPQQMVSRHSQKHYTHMIIVGGPCPTAIGSWIGNVLFSGMNRNLFSRLVLFILVNCFPLMFIGLGDLFLLLLPALHSKIASYLPYPFLTSSMFNFLFNNTLILRILVLFSFICYFIRFVFVYGFISCPDNITWNSCFVHRRHFKCYFYEHFQSFLSQFDIPKSFCNWSRRCQGKHPTVQPCIVLGYFNRVCSSLQPCEDCRNSPPKCPKHLEVPENILHNLKKQPDFFIKLCAGLSKSFQDIFCFILMIIILLPVDIIFSSPLVCLCHCRVRVLKKSLKDKFGGWSFILPILELLLIAFSLIWIVFFSFSGAVIMEIAIIGLIKTLSNHSNELLPHVAILFIACYYFWSCYSSFKMPYNDLLKKLFIPYREKFDELEKKGGDNILLNYKQGEHVKLIPKEFFNYACEHKLIDMPVRVHVAKLLVKLVLTILLFWFVFPFIRAPSLEDNIFIITFLIGVYKIINDAINGDKIKHSEKDVDRVFDDYFRGLS